jgi:thiol:disulfide interchange protein
MVMAFLTSLVCAVLLVFGFWLICVRYPDLRTPAQNVLYLAFAILGSIYIVSRMPNKISKTWRHATQPGTIEEDALEDSEEEAERREIEERDPANRTKNKKS